MESELKDFNPAMPLPSCSTSSPPDAARSESVGFAFQGLALFPA